MVISSSEHPPVKCDPWLGNVNTQQVFDVSEYFIKTMHQNVSASNANLKHAKGPAMTQLDDLSFKTIYV